jgi:hypothetical protein
MVASLHVVEKVRTFQVRCRPHVPSGFTVCHARHAVVLDLPLWTLFCVVAASDLVMLALRMPETPTPDRPQGDDYYCYEYWVSGAHEAWEPGAA